LQSGFYYYPYEPGPASKLLAAEFEELEVGGYIPRVASSYFFFFSISIT